MSPTFSGNPITQTTAFKIDDLENVQICSITIRDYLSQVVYSKVVECETGIDQPLYWKGVNNSGSAVANGTYAYEISVTNDCGSRTYTGTIVKNATFTGSVSEFFCDSYGYNAPKPCCEYEPDMHLNNLHWVNQDLLFHATSEIIVASSTPVTVGNGSNVIMRAGERIELNPGFSTDGAQSFVAEIVPCPGLRLADSEDDSTEENSPSDFKDDLSPINEERFCVYPNPNAGTFTVTGSVMQKIEVLDASGKLAKQLDCNMSTRMQIEGLTQGLYIIHVQMADGSTENAKVIVQ